MCDLKNTGKEHCSKFARDALLIQPKTPNEEKTVISQIPNAKSAWSSSVWTPCHRHLTESGVLSQGDERCKFLKLGDSNLVNSARAFSTQFDETDASLPSVARGIKKLGENILLGILSAVRRVQNALASIWSNFLVMRQNSTLRATVRASIAASPQGCAICALGTALFATFIAMSALRTSSRQRNIGRAGCAAIVVTTLFFL